eukprot:Nk52_evm3s24 gene=Nk52_evmTU3s24
MVSSRKSSLSSEGRRASAGGGGKEEEEEEEEEGGVGEKKVLRKNSSHGSGSGSDPSQSTPLQTSTGNPAGSFSAASYPVDHGSFFVVEPWKQCKSKVQEIARKPNACNTVVIPSGFQLIKTFPHQYLINSVAYNSNSESFITVDAKLVNQWNEYVHERAEVRPHLGIVIYVPSLEKYFASAKDLTISVYNANFKVLFTIDSPSPILSMEFISTTRELVCGGISGVAVFTYSDAKNDLGTKSEFQLHLSRIINAGMTEDMWVYCFHVQPIQKRLYVVLDTSLWVYDYMTGQRLETLPDRHFGTINASALVEYGAYEYFVTGAKDGTINLWQDFHHLVHTFDGHNDEISGLLAHPSGPLLVSSSHDCSVRVWNYATLEEIYRLDTAIPVMGLGLMDKENFYTYTPKELKVWQFNQILQMAAALHCDVKEIQRVEDVNGVGPPRIMVVGKDSSIRFLSCVTFSIITVVLPLLSTSVLLQVRYSYSGECVYCLFRNGEIWIFNVKTNPSVLGSIWKPKSKEDELCSTLCVVEKKGSVYDEHLGDYPMENYVVAGAKNGQIYLLNPDKQGHVSFNTQGHGDEVVNMNFVPSSNRIISVGREGGLKIWNFCEKEDEKLKIIKSVTFRGVPTMGLLFLGNVVAACEDGSLQMIRTSGQEGFCLHSSDDDHKSEITGLSVCENLHIYLTSSKDGTIKIWDAENSLIREMQLGTPVTAARFANSRGDILVGVQKHLNIIPVDYYLPAHYLTRLEILDIEDDIHESGITFDPGLEFWVYSGRTASSKNYTRRSERALQRRKTMIESQVGSTNLDKAIQYEQRHNRIISGDERAHMKSPFGTHTVEESKKEVKPQKIKKVRSPMMEKRQQRRLQHTMSLYRYLRNKLFEQEDGYDPDRAFDFWIPETPDDSDYSPTQSEVGEVDYYERVARVDEMSTRRTSSSRSRRESIFSAKSSRRQSTCRTGTDILETSSTTGKLEKGTLLKSGIINQDGKVVVPMDVIRSQGLSSSDSCAFMDLKTYFERCYFPMEGNEIHQVVASSAHGACIEIDELLIAEECFELEEVQEAYVEHRLHKESENTEKPAHEVKKPSIIAPDGHIPNSCIRMLFLHLYKQVEEAKPAAPAERWAPKPLKVRPRRKPQPLEPEEEVVVESIPSSDSSVIEEPPPPPRTPSPPAVKQPIVTQRPMSPIAPPAEPVQHHAEVVLHPAVDRVIHKKWYPLVEEVTYDVLKVVEDLKEISVDVGTKVNLREDALEALGYLHEQMDEQADEAIFKCVIQHVLYLCNDKDYTIRLNAIKLLGTFGHSEDEIIRQLIIALNDCNSSVRREATKALCSLGVDTNVKLVKEIIRLGMAVHGLDWLQRDMKLLTDMLDSKNKGIETGKCLKELTDYWFDEIHRKSKGKPVKKRRPQKNIQLNLPEAPPQPYKPRPKFKNASAKSRSLIRMLHNRELMLRKYNPEEKPNYYGLKQHAVTVSLPKINTRPDTRSMICQSGRASVLLGGGRRAYRGRVEEEQEERVEESEDDCSKRGRERGLLEILGSAKCA